MRAITIRLSVAATIALACNGKARSEGEEASGGNPAVTGGELAGEGGSSITSGGVHSETGGSATTASGASGSSGSNASGVNAGSNSDGGAISPAGGAPANSGGTGPGGAPATAGNGGEAGEGGGDVGCDCNALEQCFENTLCVARTVMLPGEFGVDATEVTRAQYAAWLSDLPGELRQSPQCEWNEDFEPNPECMAEPAVCQGADCDAHPQPCVDFCDAAVYCRSIGKQLCGGLRGPVASNDSDSLLRLACSSNDTYEMPYGDTMVPGRCNDQTANSETTVPVASRDGCQSPEPEYAGIFDLVGNLREWEDNCRTMEGPEDVCRPRGGTFGISAAAPFCSETTYADRGSFSPQIGFRCCKPR